jgi:hypothetical protein
MSTPTKERQEERIKYLNALKTELEEIKKLKYPKAKENLCIHMYASGYLNGMCIDGDTPEPVIYFGILRGDVIRGIDEGISLIENTLKGSTHIN